MPIYTYVPGHTQVGPTNYASLAVKEDDIEHFKMLKLKAGPPRNTRTSPSMGMIAGSSSASVPTPSGRFAA